jgi:hypothetical protein
MRLMRTIVPVANVATNVALSSPDVRTGAGGALSAAVISIFEQARELTDGRQRQRRTESRM